MTLYHRPLAGLLTFKFLSVTTAIAGTTPSALTLQSSANPSSFGQSVTLTAIASPSAATRRVTFYAGVSVLGTSTVSSGQATLTTVLLPSGIRPLKALYAGDATYQTSTASLSQTVAALNQNGFHEPANFGGVSFPQAVALGDFNGDGRPDLAVANYNSDNISVLLGNGNGVFRAAVRYTTDKSPISIAVGDFNGDGRTDLAVVNNATVASNVSVLIGSGDGTFKAPVNYAAGAGPNSIVVGDFNGDGFADLAVANIGSNNVSILLGNGNGTFLPPVNYAAGAGPNSIAVGDF